MKPKTIALSLITGLAILATSVLPHAAADAAPPNSRVMSYLNQISGNHTLSGQYNRQPLADPARWTNQAHTITGQWPGVYGSDFGFESPEIANRQTMIDEAKAQWNAGSLVTLSWHACPPTMPEPCDWYTDIQSKLSDDQWSQLTTSGTTLNNAWKSRLDTIVPYLLQLKSAGIEVLWRPLHEMNENVFWWGNRPGANGSAKLYQITKNYLDSKGLDNLIYVWNLDNWAQPSSFASYYPGSAYVDVASLDWYKDANGNTFPTSAAYTALQSAAPGKPISLGEVGKVPSPSQLASQPKWTYWLVWAEYLTDPNWNSNQATQATYFDGRTVNRSGIAMGNSNIAAGRSSYASSTSSGSAAAAVDGDTSTAWSTASTDPQWLYVDLGSSRTINTVQPWWTSNYARKYQIQVSTDGGTWTTVATDEAGSGGTKDISLGSVTARYVKVYMYGAGATGGYGLNELKIFGR